jgi:hypothetical protein
MRELPIGSGSDWHARGSEGPNATPTRACVTGMNSCPANGDDTAAQFNVHHAEWKDDISPSGIPSQPWI